MKNFTFKTIVFGLALLMVESNLLAFCGFYVAKADAKLFNKSSQVIIARDGDHTVITMSNDYQGDAEDFAMVVPVPEVLKESDIRVVQQFIFDKLDAYTAPRLVEYWDPNPCYVPRPRRQYSMSKSVTNAPMEDDMAEVMEEDESGVTIEATYTIGEYDILILSAKESHGLKTWLLDNGYKVPSDAEEVLNPYITDGMKFFVVKVNLEQQKALGMQTLRPLQIQFNSSRFMLPIRLGMANSSGATQDLIIYSFTKKGRVETANYRTTKLPTDRDIPEFVMEKNLFGEFYKSLYDKSWRGEGKNTVMLEYAWDVSSKQSVKCDPCPPPPITFAEMREAGVWWLGAQNYSAGYTGDLFVTRLHVRYGRKTFPQDLLFLNTPNQSSFQGRYVIHHEAKGNLNCSEGRNYKAALKMRKRKEMQELVALTGWSSSKYMHLLGDVSTPAPVKPDPIVPDPVDIDDPVGQSNQQVVKQVAMQLNDAELVEADKSGDTDIEAQSPSTQTTLEDPAASIAAADDFFGECVVEESKSSDKRPYLLLMAGLMFLGGVILRIRNKKQKS